MSNEPITLENLGAASDAELKVFIQQKAGTSKVVTSALQGRRAVLESGVTDPVELLREMLNAEEDEYNLDSLLQDINDRQIPNEYKEIANFIMAKKLTKTASNMSSDAVLKSLRQYLREDLEKQVKRILTQEQSTTKGLSQKKYNAVTAALRQTKDRMMGQRNRLVTQEGYFTKRADDLITSVDTMLKELIKTEVPSSSSTAEVTPLSVATGRSGTALLQDEIVAKFAKMKKANMPIGAIANAMIRSNLGYESFQEVVTATYESAEGGSVPGISVQEAEEFKKQFPAVVVRTATAVDLLGDISGGMKLRAATAIPRASSNTSLSSQGSETSASTAATAESAAEKAKRQLEAALAKKMPPAAAKIDKKPEQIKQELVSAIDSMLAEVELLNSGEVPIAIQRQLDELGRINQQLEEYKEQIKAKQVQLEGGAEAIQAEVRRPKMAGGLLAAIGGGTALREVKGPGAGVAKPASAKSPRDVIIESATEKRRLQMEYKTDVEFREMVDSYLQKMEAPLPAALENEIMRTHMIGLLKKHTADVDRKERLARSQAEVATRKKAEEEARKQNATQADFLASEGIHLVKTSAERLVNDVAAKLEQVIVRANKEMMKLPDVIRGLDKAIAKVAGKSPEQEEYEPLDLDTAQPEPQRELQSEQEEYEPIDISQPEPTMPIRKKSYVLSDAAVAHVPKQNTEKLAKETIEQYTKLLNLLFEYASEVQNINASEAVKNKIGAKQQAVNDETLQEICQPIVMAISTGGFKGKEITAKNIANLVKMTATTMEIANKIESAQPAKRGKLMSMLGGILYGVEKLVEKVQRVLGTYKEPPVTKSVFDQIAHLKHDLFIKVQNFRPAAH